MDFYQRPSQDYRSTLKKGRFYRTPFPMLRKKLIITRPCYDDNVSSSNKVPADLHVEEDPTINSFNHAPFSMLDLKSDEEFCLIKVKKRPVLLLNNQESLERVIVAPIYTIKPYHKKDIDIDLLKDKNDSKDILYIPSSDEFNMKESLVFLFEAMPLFKKSLEPIPCELTNEIKEKVDDKIVYMMKIYDYQEDSSSEPI
ncbi:MAG: hypothetical protein ACOCRK_01600 [bacterium]